MFCLMDVSGSMTEHMKDLAKRFYVLLYIFLKRRYKHVDVVFIRHTHQAQEVDEDTFFHSPETGGTWCRPRSRRCSGSSTSATARTVEHLRRAGVGRRQHRLRQRQDRGAADRQRSCRSASTTPISRSAAIPSTSRPASSAATPTLWQTYTAICARPARRWRCARSGTGATSIPVFRELFAKKQATTGAKRMNDLGGGMRAERPLFEGADWEFSTDPARARRDRGDRDRRARAGRLSQPDRGHRHRADAGCLFLDRHAAVLQALVVRQALRPQRGDVPRRHAGPRL